MVSTATTDFDSQAFETLLKNDLAYADQVIAHTGPILRHLLRNDDRLIFSDEVISRVRGMLTDIVRQMVQALGQVAGHSDGAAWASKTSSDLVDFLSSDQALLHHLHMLAVEWQLAEKLQGRLGIDPVLTPLLQDMIAAQDHDLAARGTNLLAAQARFGQAIRRMQLPLAELPCDLHDTILMTMHRYVADDPAAIVAAELADAALRNVKSNAASRLDLLAYVTSAAGTKANGTLSLQNAGVAVFVTALGLYAGLPRETAVMCTTESQVPRLKLSLIAAGLDRGALIDTFAMLHPDLTLPEGIVQMEPHRASALLSPLFEDPGVTMAGTSQ